MKMPEPIIEPMISVLAEKTPSLRSSAGGALDPTGEGAAVSSVDIGREDTRVRSCARRSWFAAIRRAP